MNAAIIQVKHLSKKYDRQIIFHDFNLNINKGEICAIVGSSGCGKSTLLQIIGLLDNNFYGVLLIDNQDVSVISNNEKRKMRKYKIGFIYQFHFLIPELTVEQNVALSLKLQNASQEFIKNKVDFLLQKIALQHKSQNFPHELSGGEKQRIAISRALAHNPSIILADEPTGNLDPKNTEKIFQILQNTVKTSQTTVILATHNMKIAEKCDQIINLSNQ